MNTCIWTSWPVQEPKPNEPQNAHSYKTLASQFVEFCTLRTHTHTHKARVCKNAHLCCTYLKIPLRTLKMRSINWFWLLPLPFINTISDMIWFMFLPFSCVWHFTIRCLCTKRKKNTDYLLIYRQFYWHSFCCHFFKINIIYVY